MMNNTICYDKEKLASLKEAYFRALGRRHASADALMCAEGALVDFASVMLSEDPDLQVVLQLQLPEKRESVIELILRLPTS